MTDKEFIKLQLHPGAVKLFGYPPIIALDFGYGWYATEKVLDPDRFVFPYYWIICDN